MVIFIAATGNEYTWNTLVPVLAVHVYGWFEKQFEGFEDENRSPLNLDNKVERKGIKKRRQKKGGSRAEVEDENEEAWTVGVTLMHFGTPSASPGSAIQQVLPSEVTGSTEWMNTWGKWWGRKERMTKGKKKVRKERMHMWGAWLS